MIYHLFTDSKFETMKLGENIAAYLSPNMVITLDGDLGAGKTTFTKGLGSGLGIQDTISSPTFNILKCYFNGKIPLYHIDAYRLEDGINSDIGLEEVIDGDGVAIIEWASYIKSMINDHLSVKIEIIDENTRKFSFEAFGDKYHKLLKRIEEIKS